MATKHDAESTGRRTNPTAASIAVQLGLSRATVTHVLNGRAAEQRIRPETQRRVLEVARDLGYRPNASARAVRSGRFGNVALIQSLHGQYLPRELLLGLTTAIAAEDLHLVLAQVPDTVIDDETYLPHTLRELSADGLLIARHMAFSPVYLDRIHKWHIPAIFLNTRQDHDCVHPDERMGGILAVEFLLGLGHERIAYVDIEEPNHPHFSKIDRRSGYEQAMRSAGKTPWPYLMPTAWQGSGKPTTDERVRAASALLSRCDRPTAIVAYELAEAMAVVHAAHFLGLRIPDDLSIVMFHNRIDDAYFIPFDTVSNMMEEVGKQAITMLLKKIENPDVALPTSVIPVELLKGWTCGPPPR